MLEVGKPWNGSLTGFKARNLIFHRGKKEKHPILVGGCYFPITIVTDRHAQESRDAKDLREDFSYI